jgi:hypothetical protein
MAYAECVPARQIAELHIFRIKYAQKMGNVIHLLKGLNPTVTAAIISALVGFVSGVVGSIFTIIWKLKEFRLKVRELDDKATQHREALDDQSRLKMQELDYSAKQHKEALDEETKRLSAQLRAQEEAMRQTQLTEIIKKRIETYPAFYEIISIYGRNWELEGKPWDHAWVSLFLRALLDNNAKNGVFFTEQIYKFYALLRNHLEKLSKGLATARTATDEEIAELYDIIRGPILDEKVQLPGLGSFLKDELGSYVAVAASYRHNNPYSEQELELIENPERVLRLVKRKRSERNSAQQSPAS